jgi:hypothetical protein
VCAIFGALRDRRGRRRGTNHGRQCLGAHCLELAALHRERTVMSTRLSAPRAGTSTSTGRSMVTASCAWELAWRFALGPNYLKHGARRIGVLGGQLIWARGGQRGCDKVSGHVRTVLATHRTCIRPWLVSKKKKLHTRKEALWSTHVSDDEGVCCDEQQCGGWHRSASAQV